ncbi:hypothetical protein KC342_g11976 [Hortaea werneckii]|nr:hypothetical protein KC342_g11976 [Hortaea werneckii]
MIFPPVPRWCHLADLQNGIPMIQQFKETGGEQIRSSEQRICLKPCSPWAPKRSHFNLLAHHAAITNQDAAQQQQQQQQQQQKLL